jgi:hypothetical protein
LSSAVPCSNVENSQAHKGRSNELATLKNLLKLGHGMETFTNLLDDIPLLISWQQIIGKGVIYVHGSGSLQ